MIINQQKLIELAPVKNMETTKKRAHGVSYGLSEAGIDIRIKQDVRFVAEPEGHFNIFVDDSTFPVRHGRFTLASAIEEFDMPPNLVGVVHDKSTWARRGLSVFNTVIEPGWKGFLTLELVYHGNESLHIPAGAGIAQVLFSEVSQEMRYDGKYNHQADKPVAAIYEDS